MVKIKISLDEAINFLIGTRNNNKIEVLQKLGIKVNRKSFKEDALYRMRLKAIVRKKLAKGQLIILS